MTLHLSEITGSEQPIVHEKSEGMFTYDELVYLNENPKDYNVVGFLVSNISDELYDKLYSKV